MIGSTLIEQKAAALFLFSSIETGLFRIERALSIPGQRQWTNLDPYDGCLVSARHWQAPFNRERSRFDGWKIEKVVFIQTNRSFDLNRPIELTKFRVFIYSKMKHKISKICGNLYTSGKPRIWWWQLTRCVLFSQYNDRQRIYKPVSDMCFSLILS